MCGLWCVMCGAWCVMCDVWCVVCGVCARSREGRRQEARGRRGCVWQEAQGGSVTHSLHCLTITTALAALAALVACRSSPTHPDTHTPAYPHTPTLDDSDSQSESV